MLLKQGCCAAEQGSHNVETFSAPCPSSEEAEGAQGALRGHRWDSWPQLTRGISHTVWHHAQHANWREEGETFAVMIVIFPCPCHSWWSPTLLGTPACPWEVMKEVFILLCLCTTFALAVKLSLSQLTDFLFLFQGFPPSHWRSEWAAGGISCCLGLNHDNGKQATDGKIYWTSSPFR